MTVFEKPVLGRPLLGPAKNTSGRDIRQTHRQTLRLLDQLGPEGRVGENTFLEEEKTLRYTLVKRCNLIDSIVCEF